METPIIREVCRRGRDHQNFCEDSSLVYIDEQFIHIAVFDGCSSGKDSHFASFFFSRMLRKTIKEMLFIGNDFLVVKVKKLFKQFYENLQANKKFIDVSTSEFLSTIVYLVIDKKTLITVSVISGDGEIYIDGVPQWQIKLENNNPDYLAYYLERVDTFDTWWNSTFILEYQISNNSDIAVATDGLDSFKKLGGLVTKKEIIEKLLIDRRFLNLEVMLERKCKVLENIEQTVHTDDLSIIRMIFEKQSQQ